MEKLKALATGASQWWRRQRLARALTRYVQGMGGQLSGGIALTGLLSVAAALTIGLTAMVGIFRRHPDFRDAVFTQIDNFLPGVIDMGGGQGINPENLVLDQSWNVAGIVAILVLLNTATNVMKNLRISLRSMFGLPSAHENFFVGKGRELLAFAGLGFSVLLNSLLSVGGRAAFDWIQDTIGHWGIIPDTRLVLGAMTVAFGLIVDGIVFILLFRWLAGARVPWAQLWRGALLGAVGTGALRFLGASVVANVSDNPLLASATAIATLLIWLNIGARITLFAAAWTADPPAPPKLSSDLVPHQDHSPNYVSVSAPETLEWDYGAYTGHVQPRVAEEEFSATDAAVRARARKRRAGPVRRLKDYLARQNQPDGYRYPGPEPAPPEPQPAGRAPVVRVAPDSPLGRLRERWAARRG